MMRRIYRRDRDKLIVKLKMLAVEHRYFNGVVAPTFRYGGKPLANL